MELQKLELFRRDTLSQHSVVVPGWASVIGAPDYGVSPLYHISEIPQVPILPFDEFSERGVDGAKLPTPVDGETSVLDDLSAHLGIVRGEVFGVDELVHFRIRDAVHRHQGMPRRLVSPFYPQAHSNDGLACPVPGVGEQDVVALHPFETGVVLRPDGRERSSDMDRSVHVGKRDCDEDLLPARNRV